MTPEVKVGVMSFEDGERGYEPQRAGTSGSWKRQGNTFSLEPPEGMQSCQDLFSDSIDLTVDF